MSASRLEASYHRLKRSLPPHLRREIEERAITEIIDRARSLLRHAARPTHRVAARWPEPGELDLEATLETPRPWGPTDIALTRVEPREADVVAILDMSLSMTGEKVALTALAVAILRLKLDALAIVAFDTKAYATARVGEVLGVRETVRRVLGVPAQGYTNIEAGLREATRQLERSRRRERLGIILTDGIANMGRDPVEIAHQLPRLHVVQVGLEEKQGTRTCVGMAAAGRGRRYRAHTYDDLPKVVRQLVRECFGA